jgi:hypothetical protein
LISIQLIREGKKKSKHSPHKRHIVVCHDEEVQKSVLHEVLIVPPLCDHKNKARKEEC